MFEFITSLFAPKPLSQESINYAKKLIDENNVMVFLKSYCPYCNATKNTLNSLKKDFRAVELNKIQDGDEIQRALLELTGQKTVPNIFIKGKHIGGNSDLQKLVDGGELDNLF